MVSVIIAAYNAENCLNRAVQSALGQTCTPLEVLIINDGSTDGTRRVIAQLEKQDHRVRGINLKKNTGPAAARNVGFDLANGEWIAILDADDAYLPTRVAKMVAIANRMSADVVVDNFCYCDPHSEKIGAQALDSHSTPSLVDFTEFVSKARPYGSESDWGLLKPLFRTQFLNKNKLRYPPESRHGEDFLFICGCFLAGARFVLDRQVGYLYSQRSSGWSRTRVNYELMCEHTKALADDHRVRENKQLVSAFHERLFALRRLSAARELERCLHLRAYGTALQRAFQDSLFRAAIWERISRKMKRLVQNDLHN